MKSIHVGALVKFSAWQFLLIVVLSHLSWAANTYRKQGAFDEAAISNKNIGWTAGFVGMLPVVRAKDLAKLIEQGDRSVDDLLLRALRDDERYIAAHVGLTFRHIRNPVFGAGGYNGLVITLTADHRLMIPPNQKEGLVKYWEKNLRAKNPTGSR